MIGRRRRPDGRDNLAASATLEKLKEREIREVEAEASSALFFGTVRRDDPRGAIRLINLERRARFARFAFDTN